MEMLAEDWEMMMMVLMNGRMLMDDNVRVGLLR